MIYVCNSVIATELIPTGRFQRRCEPMDHYPLNTKFLKKNILIKNLDNVQEFSKNFTFSRSLMLPQQTKESAADITCTPSAPSSMTNRVKHQV